jgi:excisionase family DNA binding protein
MCKTKKERKRDALTDLLKAKEVAEWLKISTVTLYKLIETEELPAFKVGDKWRFRREAIDEWIKKREELEKTPHKDR